MHQRASLYFYRLQRSPLSQSICQSQLTRGWLTGALGCDAVNLSGVGGTYGAESSGGRTEALIVELLIAQPEHYQRCPLSAVIPRPHWTPYQWLIPHAFDRVLIGSLAYYNRIAYITVVHNCSDGSMASLKARNWKGWGKLWKLKSGTWRKRSLFSGENNILYPEKNDQPLFQCQCYPLMNGRPLHMWPHP